MPTVLIKKEKSQAIQFLLIAFFGLLGLLYSSAAAFFLMGLGELLVYCAIIASAKGPVVHSKLVEFTFLYWFVLCKPFEFLVGALCVSHRNKEIYRRIENERRDEERRRNAAIEEERRMNAEYQKKDAERKDEPQNLDQEIERLQKLLEIELLKKKIAQEKNNQS